MSAARYDCVIVGGGPGGSAAAIECARRGLSVVLIEASAFPRDRAGETLPPGIEPLADTLGLDLSGFPRLAGYWAQWAGDLHFNVFGEDERGKWLGFHAWRADFDSRLLKRALYAGVEIRQPCRTLRPLVERSKVVGVLTERGPVEADFVVDATGGRQWLSRHLRLGISYGTPKLLASYGYLEGSMECVGPRLIADRDGWTWTSEVKPGFFHWCRLNWSGEATPAGWRPSEFSTLQAVGKPRREDVTWRVAEALAGPGFFLVGDAGWVLDPASSHGVLKAVMSGMMAGFLAGRVRCDGESAAEAEREYQQWYESLWRRDQSHLRSLYAQLADPPPWA